MGFHLIIPMERTDWRMSPEAFAKALKHRWPDVEIRASGDVSNSLDWDLRIGEHSMSGSFHQTGVGATLWGHVHEAEAIFTCWFRTLVPLEIPLVLSDDCWNDYLPLTSTTTPDDVLHGRGALEPGLTPSPRPSDPLTARCLIGPEGGAWRLAPEILAAELERRWPGVTIRRPPESPYPLEWSYRSGDSVQGVLEDSGSSIALSATLHPAAEFAMWLRTLLPPELPLVFVNNYYNLPLSVTARTTAEELVAAHFQRPRV